MKKCSKCKLEKELSQFYQRKKYRTGDYYEKCKDCMKKRGREYYYANAPRQRKLASLRKQRYIKERWDFVNVLKNKPCVDCGRMYPPWVMDFDHRNGKSKVGTISNAVRKYWHFDKIKSEIKKCDIVCSNCHRNRTYLRFHPEAAVANVVKALV